MKVFAFVVLAISGLAIAAEQQQPQARAAHAYQKDNRNLKYANNLPVAKTPAQVKIENESI
jgi:hypothetical protein